MEQSTNTRPVSTKDKAIEMREREQSMLSPWEQERERIAIEREREAEQWQHEMTGH